jgi:pimeloyl-ACP methyl ester carboxylesterase
MASFVFIPGAGGVAWYWHRAAPMLVEAGHEVIPVDLPGDDESAGIEQYADVVVDAPGATADVVLVAQSMGAFTAAMVCARVPVRRLVLVNAMIPEPGETAGEWWGNTGWEARIAAAEANGYATEFDLDTYFLHDVPKDLLEEGAEHERGEAEIAFTQPCRFDRWPAVPIHVVIGRDDRFFPAAFQERVARERLGHSLTSIHVIPGGHLVALSNPDGLAERLLAHLRT